ncbi:MAG: hypothetical protein JNL34_17835 [Anaerolineae bacterium]|nr:hypothetical protein [Anaerolineae bacterium]
MNELILQHAVFILQHDGELNAENGLTAALIYQDARIEMIGQLSKDLQLAGLVINLNLPESDETPFRMVENTQPFTLPRSKPTYETAVLQWQADGGLFVRPGLWPAYLAHLARGIQAEIDAFNLLNNVPVDDRALFSDIPLNVGSGPDIARPGN